MVKTLTGSLRNSEEEHFSVTPTTTVQAAYEAVRNATQPFDILLIDQRLALAQMGSRCLQTFSSSAPDSEGIIFTGDDSVDTVRRAYEAGARHYLHKPVNPLELTWIMRSLCQRRDAQYEREWLNVLTEVAEQAQRALSVQAIAEIVVGGGHRLGFERARLWRHSADGTTLIGVSEFGNRGLTRSQDFACRLLRCRVSSSAYGARPAVVPTARA